MTKPCKDCVFDGVTSNRSAPYPGPRCFTHMQALKKARKARAQDLRREKVYGITPELFEAIWEAQGRVCGACGKPIRSKPCIDHNHDCDQGHPPEMGCPECVRGILHPDCNRTLIGRFNVAQLIRAAKYLLDPPGFKVRREAPCTEED